MDAFLLPDCYCPITWILFLVHLHIGYDDISYHEETLGQRNDPATIQGVIHSDSRSIFFFNNWKLALRAERGFLESSMKK